MTKLFHHLDRFQHEIEDEILTNNSSIRPPINSELNFCMLEEEEVMVVVEEDIKMTDIELSLCANDTIPPQEESIVIVSVSE